MVEFLNNMETKMQNSPSSFRAAVMNSLAMGALLVTIGLSPAFAAGGSADTSKTTTPPKAVLKCKTGEVVKPVTKNGVKTESCVKVKADILPDEDLYQQARLIAKSGHYDWALEVLAAVHDQNDPRVLNYTGYSNRKAGRIEIGVTYYRKALAINPDFILAREYLGEGYVAAGRVDLARLELGEIKARAGADTEEYQNLAKEIGRADR
jgi:tetratricopeptide (TPR) repeat protein